MPSDTVPLLALLDFLDNCWETKHDFAGARSNASTRDITKQITCVKESHPLSIIRNLDFLKKEQHDYLPDKDIHIYSRDIFKKYFNIDIESIESNPSDMETNILLSSYLNPFLYETNEDYYKYFQFYAVEYNKRSDPEYYIKCDIVNNKIQSPFEKHGSTRDYDELITSLKEHDTNLLEDNKTLFTKKDIKKKIYEFFFPGGEKYSTQIEINNENSNPIIIDTIPTTVKRIYDDLQSQNFKTFQPYVKEWDPGPIKGELNDTTVININKTNTKDNLEIYSNNDFEKKKDQTINTAKLVNTYSKDSLNDTELQNHNDIIKIVKNNDNLFYNRSFKKFTSHILKIEVIDKTSNPFSHICDPSSQLIIKIYDPVKSGWSILKNPWKNSEQYCISKGPSVNQLSWGIDLIEKYYQQVLINDNPIQYLNSESEPKFLAALKTSITDKDEHIFDTTDTSNIHFHKKDIAVLVWNLLELIYTNIIHYIKNTIINKSKQDQKTIEKEEEIIAEEADEFIKTIKERDILRLIIIILYDLKKAGDWGLVQYCFEKKGKLLTLDKLCALYMVLRKVPGIFEGKFTPEDSLFTYLCIYNPNVETKPKSIKNIIYKFNLIEYNINKNKSLEFKKYIDQAEKSIDIKHNCNSKNKNKENQRKAFNTLLYLNEKFKLLIERFPKCSIIKNKYNHEKTSDYFNIDSKYYGATESKDYKIVITENNTDNINTFILFLKKLLMELRHTMYPFEQGNNKDVEIRKKAADKLSLDTNLENYKNIIERGINHPDLVDLFEMITPKLTLQPVDDVSNNNDKIINGINIDQFVKDVFYSESKLQILKPDNIESKDTEESQNLQVNQVMNYLDIIKLIIDIEDLSKYNYKLSINFLLNRIVSKLINPKFLLSQKSLTVYESPHKYISDLEEKFGVANHRRSSRDRKWDISNKIHKELSNFKYFSYLREKDSKYSIETCKEQFPLKDIPIGLDYLNQIKEMIASKGEDINTVLHNYEKFYSNIMENTEIGITIQKIPLIISALNTLVNKFSNLNIDYPNYNQLINLITNKISIIKTKLLGIKSSDIESKVNMLFILSFTIDVYIDYINHIDTEVKDQREISNFRNLMDDTLISDFFNLIISSNDSDPDKDTTEQRIVLKSILESNHESILSHETWDENDTPLIKLKDKYRSAIDFFYKKIAEKTTKSTSTLYATFYNLFKSKNPSIKPSDINLIINKYIPSFNLIKKGKRLKKRRDLSNLCILLLKDVDKINKSNDNLVIGTKKLNYINFSFKSQVHITILSKLARLQSKFHDLIYMILNMNDICDKSSDKSLCDVVKSNTVNIKLPKHTVNCLYKTRLENYILHSKGIIGDSSTQSSSIVPTPDLSTIKDKDILDISVGENIKVGNNNDDSLLSGEILSIDTKNNKITIKSEKVDMNGNNETISVPIENIVEGNDDKEFNSKSEKELNELLLYNRIILDELKNIKLYKSITKYSQFFYKLNCSSLNENECNNHDCNYSDSQCVPSINAIMKYMRKEFTTNTYLSKQHSTEFKESMDDIKDMSDTGNVGEKTAHEVSHKKTPDTFSVPSQLQDNINFLIEKYDTRLNKIKQMLDKNNEDDINIPIYSWDNSILIDEIIRHKPYKYTDDWLTLIESNNFDDKDIDDDIRLLDSNTPKEEVDIKTTSDTATIEDNDEEKVNTYKSMKSEDLRKMLSSRNLTYDGTKKTLIGFLEKDDVDILENNEIKLKLYSKSNIDLISIFTKIIKAEEKAIYTFICTQSLWANCDILPENDDLSKLLTNVSDMNKLKQFMNIRTIDSYYFEIHKVQLYITTPYIIETYNVISKADQYKSERNVLYKKKIRNAKTSKQYIELTNILIEYLQFLINKEPFNIYSCDSIQGQDTKCYMNIDDITIEELNKIFNINELKFIKNIGNKFETSSSRSKKSSICNIKKGTFISDLNKNIYEYIDLQTDKIIKGPLFTPGIDIDKDFILKLNDKLDILNDKYHDIYNDKYCVYKPKSNKGYSNSIVNFIFVYSGLLYFIYTKIKDISL